VERAEDSGEGAAELVKQIQSKASVDWWKFEQRRAQIRVAIKHILRKYGYPSALQAAAVKTVVEQAEVLAMELAGREGFAA
jgi:type I restriction enzyme R subunit